MYPLVLLFRCCRNGDRYATTREFGRDEVAARHGKECARFAYAAGTHMVSDNRRPSKRCMLVEQALDRFD
jgi:hypothetical protein